MQCVAATAVASAPLRASARASVRSTRRVSGLRVQAFREEGKDVKTSVKETRAEVVDKLNASSAEIVEKVQAFWEESEEKPTIVAVGIGSILAVYFAGTIVDAVDRLPLISTGLELIGLAFTGWTAYRYFLVDGEKSKMTSEVKSFAKKVGLDL